MVDFPSTFLDMDACTNFLNRGNWMEVRYHRDYTSPYTCQGGLQGDVDLEKSNVKKTVFHLNNPQNIFLEMR